MKTELDDLAKRVFGPHAIAGAAGDDTASVVDTRGMPQAIYTIRGPRAAEALRAALRVQAGMDRS